MKWRQIIIIIIFACLNSCFCLFLLLRCWVLRWTRSTLCNSQITQVGWVLWEPIVPLWLQLLSTWCCFISECLACPLICPWPLVTLKSPERIFSQELKEELYLVWKWLHFLSGLIRECLIQRFFRQDNYCSKLLNFDRFKPTWDTWLSGKWTQESYLILFKFHIKTEDEKTKLNGFILCCYEMLPEGGCKNICASLCEG